MNSVKNPFELITQDKELATVLSIKSKLTMLITQIIRTNEWTQKYVANKLGITQPRVSNLMRGQLNKFTIDMLISISMRLGAEATEDFQDRGVLTFELKVV